MRCLAGEEERAQAGDNITVTGLSLGGSITDHLASSNHDIKALAFNRGSCPLQTLEKDQKNVIDVSNINDPVSYFARSSKGNQY